MEKRRDLKESNTISGTQKHWDSMQTQEMVCLVQTTLLSYHPGLPVGLSPHDTCISRQRNLRRSIWNLNQLSTSLMSYFGETSATGIAIDMSQGSSLSMEL